MLIRDIVGFNPSRYYLEKFVKQAATSLKPGFRVLDAGAGHSPYQKLFRHVHYDAVDMGLAYWTDNNTLTYICDLRYIPSDAEVYDAVICTQVLEHVKEPTLVLSELYRLLKPGGYLWLSAPLFYPEHQVPHDYYRYTQYGLQHLVISVGFIVKQLEPLEGYYGTLAYQMQKGAQNIPLQLCSQQPGMVANLVLMPILAVAKFLFAGLSVFFAYLDVYHKLDIAGYCKNYTVIAVKPL
jgi:SAM-dependent methyltransferase